MHAQGRLSAKAEKRGGRPWAILRESLVPNTVTSAVNLDSVARRCSQMDLGADEGKRSLENQQLQHNALLAGGLQQDARAFQTRREVYDSGRKQRSYALSHPAPAQPRSAPAASLLPSKVEAALEVTPGSSHHLHTKSQLLPVSGHPSSAEPGQAFNQHRD